MFRAPPKICFQIKCVGQTAGEHLAQLSPSILDPSSIEGPCDPCREPHYRIPSSSSSPSKPIIFLASFSSVLTTARLSAQLSPFNAVSNGATQQQFRGPCREPRYRIPLLFLFLALILPFNICHKLNILLPSGHFLDIYHFQSW